MVPDTGPSAVTESQNVEPMNDESEAIPEGSHVGLISHGHYIGSGVIDAWMPDGSAFWIWLDHGAGRRLVHESDVVNIVVSGPIPDTCSWGGNGNLVKWPPLAESRTRGAPADCPGPQEWDAGASP
jgi:hypothetical protein